MTDLSRRTLLEMATIGAAGIAAAPSASAAQGRGPYPPDVGSKFHADGRVHPFAGNTIICHLPQQGDHAAAFDAMLDIYREAPAHDFMRKVAMLPPSSYHMTVFGGANDAPRRRENWPADLPLDLPIATCDRILGERLRGFDPGLTLPIRMRVDPVQTPLVGGALIFRLQPLDAGENAKLRALRDRLADLLKIRAANHDAYQFHVSLGYKIGWLTEVEARKLERTWHRWAAHIAAQSPEIVLGAPEYCAFADMFAFRRRLYIGKSASCA